MLSRRLMLGVALAAAAAVALPGAGRTQGNSGPIRIATAGPMTGQYAAFGGQMRAGAEQAVADINAKGGVLGRQLVLEVGDDACDPRQAVSVANQLASRGVRFVAGHFCSGSSIPASKVYADEGILQISPASTNPKFTDEGSWNTFRVCGRDDQQGQVAGKYIAEHFKGDKIAVLNDNSAYGKGLADETTKALKAAGVTPALEAAYTPGERDYSALVSRLKAAGIQTEIVIWSAPPRYRYPDCQGGNWGGQILKDGCVPRDNAMDDFEDFFNFIAQRYSGKVGTVGKVYHYIVWNEAASGLWLYSSSSPS